mgnify:CR=1 FL=1
MSGWITVEEVMVLKPGITAARVRYLAMRDRWPRVRWGKRVGYDLASVLATLGEG